MAEIITIQISSDAKSVRFVMDNGSEICDPDSVTILNRIVKELGVIEHQHIDGSTVLYGEYMCG